MSVASSIVQRRTPNYVEKDTGGVFNGNITISKAIPTLILASVNPNDEGQIEFTNTAAQNARIRHEVADGNLKEAGQALIFEDISGTTFHIEVIGNAYAKRFYDYDNTGYYLDPASNSVLGGNLTLGGMYLRDNSIEQNKSNSEASIAVNYYGYAGGATQFRNFNVYDGKTNPILSITGSSKAAVFAGDVSIAGKLTLSGDTTVTIANEVKIGDNILTLNADWPDNTAPTENAGIEIYRGTGTGAGAMVSLLWDETNDWWKFGEAVRIEKQLTNYSLNETPAYNTGAINLQPSTAGGATGITFRSNVNSTSDAGYLWWYDDNNNYARNDSTENGVLLLAVQNDGSTATSGDAIAIESSGDIYLNAGVASGGQGAGTYNTARGDIFVGNAATKYLVRHEGNFISGTDYEVPLTFGTYLTRTNNEINHDNSGVTAAAYGDTSNQTPGYGGTFKVPSFTVDAQGHITVAGDHTVTIPASDNTDTKNTAGSNNSNSKLFLIGATTQDDNPVTYSDSEVYTTNGTLTTNKIEVGGGSARLEYNTTTKSIDFIFA